MKRALSIVLAAVMAASILTACGGGSKGSDGGQQAAAQTKQAVTGSKQVVAETKTETQTKKAEVPAEDTKAVSAAQTQDVTSDGYVIMVIDTDNAPVVGARVQFCSDTTCFMGKTDDTGCAVFNEPEGKYTVHVLKAPEGYKKTDEEFAVPETYGIVKIVLEKE